VNLQKQPVSLPVFLKTGFFIGRKKTANFVFKYKLEVDGKPIGEMHTHTDGRTTGKHNASGPIRMGGE